MERIKTASVIFISSVILAFAFSPAFTQDTLQTEEFKEYTIMKGDTLWDISSKEIQSKDPFLWPKIWKENLQIKNPDLIYPGQTIRIPLRLLEEAAKEKESIAVQEPTTEEPKKDETVKKEEPSKIMVAKKIEPVDKQYLASREMILSGGYITDYISKEIKNVGFISGAPTGRIVFGDNDYIYIKTNAPAKTGDKFYIIRSNGLIRHPKTDDKIGSLITVIGIAEVLGPENGATKAKIIKSFNQSYIGDLLDNYYDVEPIMEEQNPRKPSVSGVIVAIQHLKNISGDSDIVFIDKGSQDGLQVGDALQIISYDDYIKSRTIGVLQIINVKNSSATALIRKTEGTVRAGDIVGGLK